ncbi:hypothetical protein KII95_05385 [Leuconostoc gelidum subsp. aenigmaticum]|uniref:hypothetical protein n=1 Tax=Leuconostoc gelidum TaxID=1244 RepID=UPI001CC69301|nr:hypothetical protein [Leuconostoc gelidum]MBZ6003449.1 hypothetical protein [Leuconostoc gelidum subsp. aenigmaticum]
MNKVTKLCLTTLGATVLATGFLLTSPNVNVSAENIYTGHQEFRWNSPTDWSYNQQKWTTSAYKLYATKMSVPSYTATAWGHSYLAGRTGNANVSEGRSYVVRPYSNVYLYNKLVEWYGTGNNAFINAYSQNNGSADGSWYAD